MEKEEAALTVTEQQPVWPRCTFHLRRGNGTHAKFKEIHSVEKHKKYAKNILPNLQVHIQFAHGAYSTLGGAMAPMQNPKKCRKY